MRFDKYLKLNTSLPAFFDVQQIKQKMKKKHEKILNKIKSKNAICELKACAKFPRFAY